MTAPKTTHIVFLEHRDQVLWIRNNHFLEPSMTLIALTAEALQALEELEYQCFAVCDFIDTSPLVSEEEHYIKEIYSLSLEIENYIGDYFDGFKTDGPGVISGNYYFLQYCISSIVKRAYILKKLVTTFSPLKITVFQQDIDAWLHGWQYVKNPWDEILETFSHEYNFSIEYIRVPRKKNSIPALDFAKVFSYYNRIKRKIIQLNFARQQKHSISSNLDGCRIIFVNSTNYDWGPVVRQLKQNKKIGMFELEQYNLYKHLWWSAIFSPALREMGTQKKTDIPINREIITKNEKKTLELLFEKWLSERENPPTIKVFDINIFPYIIPQIRTLVVQGLIISRYTDSFALHVIQKTKPHIVCFFNITQLSERRFAYICEKKGIPTVCYQHGFGYNVGIQPGAEGCDQACADFILSYGEGNRPRTNPLFPVKAEFFPVGSARIENMKKINPCRDLKKGRILKILWIAESTSHNTLVASLTEDTKRYRMQKKCMSILSGKNNIQVIYRPLISQLFFDGTSVWLRNEKISGISIDAFTPLEDLILDSDLVISDISSPTTWGEVLGLNKPMILYCDPKQTPIKESSIPDLDSACCWCKTEDGLLRIIKELGEDPDHVFTYLHKMDSSAFVRKYILHDENCTDNVCNFFYDRIYKFAQE